MLGSGNPMVRSLTLHSMSSALPLSGWSSWSLHMLSQPLSACDHSKQLQGLLTVQMHVMNRKCLTECTICTAASCSAEVYLASTDLLHAQLLLTKTRSNHYCYCCFLSFSSKLPVASSPVIQTCMSTFSLSARSHVASNAAHVIACSAY